MLMNRQDLTQEAKVSFQSLSLETKWINNIESKYEDFYWNVQFYTKIWNHHLKLL